MSDLRKIHKEYLRLKKQFETKLALVTVLEVFGSSFRRPGAMMLVTENSQWFGSISGGCLEGDSLKRARHSLLNGQPVVIMYDTINKDDHALGPQIGCNGIVKILIEPLKVGRSWLDDLTSNDLSCSGYLVTRILHARTIRIERALIDAKTQKRYNRISHWPIETDDLLAMINVTSKFKQDEDAQWVVQKLPVLNRLVIAGGGNHILPLIRLAKSVHWEVIVTDPCVAHAAPALFKEADEVIRLTGDQIGSLVSRSSPTAVVITSHDDLYLEAGLYSLLENEAKYIGLIGNRIRLKSNLNQIFGEHVPIQIHAPVGLDLGGNTPEEMALSIVSEIMSYFNHKTALPLNELSGYIHDRLPQEVTRDTQLNIS